MRLSVYRLTLPALSLILTACGGGGGGGNFGAEPPATAAVVATRAPDFSSGAVSLVDFEAPFEAQNNLPPNGSSDILVRSGGDHYFVIERFNANRVQRFAVSDPSTPVYQNGGYSTQDADDTTQSNPADLVILSPTKAYLLRYGSDVLWIVNPSATTEAAFKIGEIDLSHYDTADNVPEMTAGLIQDGLLYVLLQRLENFSAVKSGYVAVIDTINDEEIDTDSVSGNLPGIELPVRNPSGIAANPGNDDLIVLAAGGGEFVPPDFDFVSAFDGGIVRIDTGAFSSELLVDDGSPGAAPFGQLTELAVVAADRAYFYGTEDFASETLFRFDPTSSAAPVAVSVAQDVRLSALSADAQGRLWLGRAELETPGLTVLGFADGTETVIEDRIDTVLTPINIDFVSAP
ncbi:hypothetical protein [Panacagrimonas sp.]|uniref:hypothetical protein n=1 Tax=Panacagrimonas sp. TaxID=2480088 RepID=UPI003B51742F